MTEREEDFNNLAKDAFEVAIKAVRLLAQSDDPETLVEVLILTCEMDDIALRGIDLSGELDEAHND